MLALAAWTAALAIFGVFAALTADLVFHGFERLSWDFFTTGPERAGRAGGIAPIIVSTLLILAVAMGVSLPLGLGTALLLAEYTRRRNLFGRVVRRSLDVLAGVPSIVFGLFGSVFFCKILGLGFSILSGGLTLACMVLPILIRATVEGFRAVPDEYRLGTLALGYSKVSALRYILLPAAVPGLIVGIVLGIGRAIAETAALIFTSGYVDRMPDSLFDSGRSLSIHIFDLSMNISGGDSAAYASSLTLVIILLAINLLAHRLMRFGFGRRVLL
jgi:phosphate transport system permease protein